MKHALTTLCARAALVLAVASPFSAQAGLVTGVWDPLFGPFLPGLSYQVRAEFSVPDACSQQGNGTYVAYGTSANAACTGASVVSAKLRLFDPGSDPSDFFQRDADSFWFELADPNNYGVAEVRVQDGLVLAVSAGLSFNLPLLTPPAMGTFTNVVATALNNSFGLHFTLLGPVVTCFDCSNASTPPNEGNRDEQAGTTGLTQFLVTFNDNNVSKAGTDRNGNPIGAVLDSRGAFVRLGTSAVPEPGALGLTLAALLALGAVGQRRRRH